MPEKNIGPAKIRVVLDVSGAKKQADDLDRELQRRSDRKQTNSEERQSEKSVWKKLEREKKDDLDQITRRLVEEEKSAQKSRKFMSRIERFKKNRTRPRKSTAFAEEASKRAGKFFRRQSGGVGGRLGAFAAGAGRFGTGTAAGRSLVAGGKLAGGAALAYGAARTAASIGGTAARLVGAPDFVQMGLEELNQKFAIVEASVKGLWQTLKQSSAWTKEAARIQGQLPTAGDISSVANAVHKMETGERELESKFNRFKRYEVADAVRETWFGGNNQGLNR